MDSEDFCLPGLPGGSGVKRAITDDEPKGEGGAGAGGPCNFRESDYLRSGRPEAKSFLLTNNKGEVGNWGRRPINI